MRNFLRILYQPYKWLVYIPFLIVSTLVLGAAAIVIATTISPKLASATCGVWWARLNSFMAPMFVTVRGRHHIDKKQSYVIVSNHLSHLDIFVLYGWLGIDFKWVMKKELRNTPALGAACEKIGHIYIDRSDRETAIASLAAAKTKIVDGTSILFFPEGTRSTSGEMRPFKKGAFVMALDLGIQYSLVTDPSHHDSPYGHDSPNTDHGSVPGASKHGGSRAHRRVRIRHRKAWRADDRHKRGHPGRAGFGMI